MDTSSTGSFSVLVPLVLYIRRVYLNFTLGVIYMLHTSHKGAGWPILRQVMMIESLLEMLGYLVFVKYLSVVN